jgi:hypothetical protein
MHIIAKHILVLRDARESDNYEQLVPNARLRETINQIIDDYDASLKRARERKRANYWTILQLTELAQKNRERWSMGEMADHFGRSAKNVEDRLVQLKELERRDIRRPIPEQEQTIEGFKAAA